MPFLSGYTRRKKLTIDNANVGSALTDFPVAWECNADGDIGLNIDSNGYNIRFTSSDGTTVLKYERKNFVVASNQATGQFYIKVPTVSSASDTEIYVYYKSAAPSDGEDAENVWNSGYKAVFHMEESSLAILDSTANNNDRTDSGGPTRVTGTLGYAASFDGTDDYMRCGAGASLDLTNWTLEAIMTLDSTPGIGGWMIDKANGSTRNYEFFVNTTPALSTAFTHSGGTGSAVSVGATTLPTATPVHVASTYDGSNLKVWYQGAVDDTEAETNTPETVADELELGSLAGLGILAFPGDLDEVRVSSAVRSADWLNFTRYNLLESDNEITVGTEETEASGSRYPYRSNPLRIWKKAA